MNKRILALLIIFCLPLVFAATTIEHTTMYDVLGSYQMMQEGVVGYNMSAQNFQNWYDFEGTFNHQYSQRPLVCDFSNRNGNELVYIYDNTGEYRLWDGLLLPMSNYRTNATDNIYATCTDLDNDGYNDVVGIERTANGRYITAMKVEDQLVKDSFTRPQFNISDRRYLGDTAVTIQSFMCTENLNNETLCGLQTENTTQFFVYAQSNSSWTPIGTINHEVASSYTGFFYMNATDIYAWHRRNISRYSYNISTNTITRTVVGEAAGNLQTVQFMHDANGTVENANLSRYNAFVSVGETNPSVQVWDATTFATKTNFSSTIATDFSCDAERLTRATKLAIYDTNQDSFADVHLLRTTVTPGAGIQTGTLRRDRYRWNETTNTLMSAESGVVNTVSTACQGVQVVTRASVIHEYGAQTAGWAPDLVDSFPVMPTTNVFDLTDWPNRFQDTTRGNVSADSSTNDEYPVFADLNDDGYFDFIKEQNDAVYYHGNGSFQPIENHERLARPKFLNTPVRLGDTPLAVSIYRHNLSMNASIIVEWQLNNSVYVQNTTIQVEFNSSFNVNLSTDFVQPGANITVYMRAWTPMSQSERKNRSISVAVSECSDFIDNDLDGDIDYPDDEGCSAPLDDSEDTDNPISTVEISGFTSCGQPSGGGSTIIMFQGLNFAYNSQGFIATEEIIFGTNDTLIDDLLDRQKEEICGNEIDDNEDGFIDETCTKLIEVTTENNQKSYNLFITPGETRMREVLVKNVGPEIAKVQMTCTGSTLCNSVALKPRDLTLPLNEQEAVSMSIFMPEDTPLGERFAMKIVGKDNNQNAIDNILVSITVSDQGERFRQLSEFLTRPVYCTNVATEGARNFCIPLWLAGIAGMLLGVLGIFIFRLILQVVGTNG